jgi:hypothetical protein
MIAQALAKLRETSALMPTGWIHSPGAISRDRVPHPLHR